MSFPKAEHHSALTPAERDDIASKFQDVVNMRPDSLMKWLATEDSKRVGYKSEGQESVGHRSGERIVTLLTTPKTDLTEDDFQHMRKVVGYVHRHSAQGPSKHDVATSDWRYSLMNWGHDPMQDPR